MGMSQNSDARNFPLSVKYINISFEHPYLDIPRSMRMPVLQELQPFIVHAAFSAPRWHQRAGWATQWKNTGTVKLTILLCSWLFLLSSTEITFIPVCTKVCMQPSLKCCRTRIFVGKLLHTMCFELNLHMSLDFPPGLPSKTFAAVAATRKYIMCIVITQNHC